MKFTLSVISLSFIILVTSCNKDDQACDSTNCLGAHSLSLSSDNKAQIITKDTTYQFASITDTLYLKYVETYNTIYTQTATCECSDKSTAIYGEARYGRYKFIGRNIAMHYLGAASYPDKLGYDLLFADTNMILHGNTNNNYSLFRNYDLNTRTINMDSLQIDSVYYHNIIKDYDVVSTVPHLVTECFFSKKTGIVRFTLDSVVYHLVH